MKPLRWVGRSRAGVLEVVEDHTGNAYRAVYTVRFVEAVYVLHAFQKKAVRAIATPKREMDLIKDRLTQVESMR
jgi:phage-related protein